MSVISRRIDRVETAMKARAGDLSLLSDEELGQRARDLVTRLIESREPTIAEWSAMTPAELNIWRARLDSLASMLGDGDFGLVDMREMFDVAMQKREDDHARH